MCNKKTALVLLFSPLVVGWISGFLNAGAMAQYQTLVLPPLSPPPGVFSVAWTILYLLMGLGAALVYCSDGNNKQVALRLFALQLGVNFLWSFFYFTLEWRLFAFLWLVLLFLLAYTMAKEFSESSTLAGKLQIPYLVWLVFAGYLNLATWWLNR